jgi:hypothetical protein
MKFMKRIQFNFSLLAIIATLLGLVGCATSPKQTEQLLTQAGFQRIPAVSDKQMQHLLTLTPDKLTIARINGKPFYVFPDPDNKQIYVGNTEQFQTYQQLLTYRKLNADSRVLAVEDEGPGDDTGKWVQWTETTGWTHGTFND